MALGPPPPEPVAAGGTMKPEPGGSRTAVPGGYTSRTTAVDAYGSPARSPAAPGGGARRLPRGSPPGAVRSAPSRLPDPSGGSPGTRSTRPLRPCASAGGDRSPPGTAHAATARATATAPRPRPAPRTRTAPDTAAALPGPRRRRGRARGPPAPP